MKKNLGKIIAMAIAAIMMMSTIAFADVALPNPEDAVENIVTATLSGLDAGKEATILVVKDEVDPSTLTSSNTSDIVYIDQVTVGDDGKAVFTFDASAALPEEVTADVYVDIYCGYSDMTGGALTATAKLFTYVEEEEVDPILEFDAYVDGFIDSSDALVLLMYEARLIDTIPYIEEDSGAVAPSNFTGNAYKDEFIDSSDALVILMYEARLIDTIPYIEEE